MAGGGYEFFEHTADVGLRLWGSALEELFAQAARGFVELVAGQSVIALAEARPVSLAAASADALLLAWLNELVFWFSTDHFLPGAYQLTSVTETSLVGHVRGERFDPARHQAGTEVKGVTRHQLHVERRGGQWHAQVIVDV